MYRNNRNRRAFSLVELMIVVAIMGILATAVTVNVRAHIVKARQNVATTDISRIAGELEVYLAEFGRFPTTDEGLAKLMETSDEFPEPLLTKLPRDPWKNPYQYVSAGPRDFELVCLGADGAPGGAGVNRDISSADLRGDGEQ